MEKHPTRNEYGWLWYGYYVSYDGDCILVVVGYLLRGSPAICITETLPIPMLAMELLVGINKCSAKDIEIVGIKNINFR